MRKYVQKEHIMTNKTLGSSCSDQSSLKAKQSLFFYKGNVGMKCSLPHVLVSLNRGGMLCTLWKAITDFRDKQRDKQT